MQLNSECVYIKQISYLSFNTYHWENPERILASKSYGNRIRQENCLITQVTKSIACLCRLQVEKIFWLTINMTECQMRRTKQSIYFI